MRLRNDRIIKMFNFLVSLRRTLEIIKNRDSMICLRKLNYNKGSFECVFAKLNENPRNRNFIFI